MTLDKALIHTLPVLRDLSQTFPPLTTSENIEIEISPIDFRSTSLASAQTKGHRFVLNLTISVLMVHLHM